MDKKEIAHLGMPGNAFSSAGKVPRLLFHHLRDQALDNNSLPLKFLPNRDEFPIEIDVAVSPDRHFENGDIEQRVFFKRAIVAIIRTVENPECELKHPPQKEKQ